MIKLYYKIVQSHKKIFGVIHDKGSATGLMVSQRTGFRRPDVVDLGPDGGSFS